MKPAGTPFIDACGWLPCATVTRRRLLDGPCEAAHDVGMVVSSVLMVLLPVLRWSAKLVRGIMNDHRVASVSCMKLRSRWSLWMQTLLVVFALVLQHGMLLRARPRARVVQDRDQQSHHECMAADPSL